MGNGALVVPSAVTGHGAPAVGRDRRGHGRTPPAARPRLAATVGLPERLTASVVHEQVGAAVWAADLDRLAGPELSGVGAQQARSVTDQPCPATK